MQSGTSTSDTAPVDVATMRENIGRLLLPEGTAPTDAELTTLTSLLRSHIELITPEIEAAAAKLHKDDIPRYCALACAGEARGRLRTSPSPAPGGRIAHARRLARSLNALCDHYEALTGVSMCLACDQPIQAGEEARPYDHASPSGGAAKAGRIHARCANTVRRH